MQAFLEHGWPSNLAKAKVNLQPFRKVLLWGLNNLVLGSYVCQDFTQFCISFNCKEIAKSQSSEECVFILEAMLTAVGVKHFKKALKLVHSNLSLVATDSGLLKNIQISTRQD